MDKLNYSKTQIDKAGYIIANCHSKKANTLNIKIVEDWRACHARPMNLLATKLKKLFNNRRDVIIAERLKRLDTIINKLSRFPEMKLSRMQDLGGCRVILPSIKDLYSLRDMLIQMNDSKFCLHHEKDYIINPNLETGYRGIHLIFKYNMSEINKEVFIELQLRTKLQHLWATAVESVGMFTDNNLKFNQGEDCWIEFFRLSSQIFAEEERRQIATIDDVKKHLSIIEDFFSLDKKFGLTNKLYTFAAANVILESAASHSKSGFYLLQLDMKTPTLQIRYFKNNKTSMKEAINAYMEVEMKKSSTMDVVLVSAKSINILQKAFPNYFANVSEFTACIVKYVGEQLAWCKSILNNN